MNHYPRSLSTLIGQFSKLPGIGKKTAERLALHVLRAPLSEAEKLAGSILALKKSICLCARCFALSDTNICHICSNPKRNTGKICVVENATDMAAIEKSSSFTGVYHIIQGLFSPMENIGPDEIRLQELCNRINNEKVEEVILALNTTVEGETTANYIIKLLTPFNISITKIASGVPVGGDLKYIDPETLKRAMEARRGT